MPVVGTSSANIRPQAQAALKKSRIGELRSLCVEQHNGALVLSGVVSSFYVKQLAQEAVRALCRDIEVELVNAIRVDRGPYGNPYED